MNGDEGSGSAAGNPTAAHGATSRPVTDLVVEHVRNVLRAYWADDQARRRRARELERAGYRIIDGGHTEGDSWAIYDWRTREVLASSDRGEPGDAAGTGFDPHRTWFHYDWLEDDVPLSEITTISLPPSLVLALDNWIGRTTTPDAEIAELIGWPVETVHDCRG